MKIIIPLPCGCENKCIGPTEHALLKQRQERAHQARIDAQDCEECRKGGTLCVWPPIPVRPCERHRDAGVVE